MCLVRQSLSSPGFRADGWFSLYFGSDPVFHFDAEGALRRAFVSGDLYRSQVQTLARLTRTRSADGVEMVRHDLDAAELEEFMAAIHVRLDRFLDALRSGAAQVIRQVPTGADLTPRLIAAVQAARQGRLSAAIRRRK
jgi:hypothetical protein